MNREITMCNSIDNNEKTVKQSTADKRMSSNTQENK